MREDASSRSDDPAGILLAAVQRSTRAMVVVGASLVVLALFVYLTGASKHQYVLGVLPLPWFMLALGALVPIVAVARASAFKALEFRLVGGGVRTSDTSILWDDIAEIYRGGTVYLAQGLIRSGEERRLRIVARDGRQIEVELRLFGRESKEVARALTAITEELLRHVLERQRRELAGRLAAGERVRFNDELWIGADGVARSRDDPGPIPLASVLGIECDDGRLKLHYVDAKRRPRSRSLGAFQETANVHLLDWALQPREPQVAEGERRPDAPVM